MGKQTSHNQNNKIFFYILWTVLFFGLPTLLLRGQNPQDIPGSVYAILASVYYMVILGIGEYFKSDDSSDKEGAGIRRLENELEVFTQLLIMLKDKKLVPTSQMQPDYKNLAYDCACGGLHILSQTRYLLCSRPVKFFFLCENQICTLVRVKGAISQTAIPEWFTDADSFISALGKLREINGQF